MTTTVRSDGILFNNGTLQTTAATSGIAAQNCSYTGSLVETAGINMASTNAQTADLGSNRVATGMRKYWDNCSANIFLYLRGYNIKNTA